MKTKITVNTASDAQLNYAMAKADDHQWRCPWILEKEGYQSWMSYENGWGNPTPHYTAHYEWTRKHMEAMVVDGFILQMANFNQGIKFWKLWPSDDHMVVGRGPTVLIAVCRARLLTVYGEILELPEEIP